MAKPDAAGESRRSAIMVARVMVANLSKQDIAQQRIELFQEAYGEQALDVACHLAFPLTMTTDLSYCLRQQFFPEMHWSIAATVVLSGLYEEVGYDLYEMAVATRSLLLARLVENFGNVRLFEISDFMQGYILYRLTQNAGDRPQTLGDPAEWIALACLAKGEGKFREMIRRELQDLLAKSPDINERFRLAALIHQQGDLLAQRGFEAFSIQELAGRIAKGEPIDPLSDIRQFMEANGFPELKSEEIEYATIVFDPVSTEEELHAFEFETVTIDRTGKEVDRQKHTAYSFTESLADGVGLEMVAIPSGKFMMGSPSDEKDSHDLERPQHEVTVQPFFIGQTPVTHA
ncbi:MAG: SUMF1/EgtB/PvdO family nonheme iron enzyme, partial [Alkalinema sp. CAN_BIN05]|nr:SUMF1/EgtB/PvdO family nonheme iron enzyme [Alkalinema sp. CAN_BIN05]